MAEGLRLLRQMGLSSSSRPSLVVGLLDVLISTELISSWLGQEAGLRAILIAIAAGVLAARPALRDLSHHRRAFFAPARVLDPALPL